MRYAVGVLAVLLMFGGCVLTVQPIIPEDGRMLDERLLGRWEYGDGPEVAVVSQAEDSEYLIVYTDGEGEEGTFGARLGSVGDRLVLDVWPIGGPDEFEGPASGLVIAGHMPLMIEITPDSILIAEIRSNYLLEALSEGEISFAHTIADDRVILTDSTAVLRQQVAWILERPDALEFSTWRRTEEKHP